MLALTKERTTKGFADIRLRVPAKDASRIIQAIEKFLALAGMPVQQVGESGRELYSLEEVFPDMHPGHTLRGARLHNDLTQKRLAEIIGVKPSHISEMEHGKRPIGREMAKRLASALNTDYKVFL